MHVSVLLNETIESLNLKDNSIVVDMTLGFAGHSSQILKRIKNGYLFAFDQDEEALKFSKEKLSKIIDRFRYFDYTKYGNQRRRFCFPAFSKRAKRGF